MNCWRYFSCKSHVLPVNYNSVIPTCNVGWYFSWRWLPERDIHACRVWNACGISMHNRTQWHNKTVVLVFFIDIQPDAKVIHILQHQLDSVVAENENLENDQWISTRITVLKCAEVNTFLSWWLGTRCVCGLWNVKQTWSNICRTSHRTEQDLQKTSGQRFKRCCCQFCQGHHLSCSLSLAWHSGEWCPGLLQRHSKISYDSHLHL